MKSQFAVSVATYTSIVMFLMITMYSFAQPPQHRGKSSQKPAFSHERKYPGLGNFQHGRSNKLLDAPTSKTLHNREGRSGRSHPGYRGSSQGRRPDTKPTPAEIEKRKEAFKKAIQERLTCPNCGHVKEMPKRPEFNKEEGIKSFRIGPPYPGRGYGMQYRGKESPKHQEKSPKGPEHSK